VHRAPGKIHITVYAVYPARPWLAFKTATFVAFFQERLFA